MQIPQRDLDVTVMWLSRSDEPAALNQSSDERNFIEGKQEALKGKKPLGGNPTAYL